MASLFLSYARNDDEAFVKTLYEHLTAQGFMVWWDRVSMPSRALTFLQEIRDAIDASDRLVVVVGPKAVESDYVRAEWQYALSNCKIVTPVLRLGDYDLLPESLSKLHCPDMRQGRPLTDSLAELIRVLTDPVLPLGPLYNVPSLPPHFLPRPEEITRLKDTLLADINRPTVITSATRTATLQGMGGAGKSVLAAAFAHECEMRRAFSDGILWLTVGQQPNLLESLMFAGQVFGDTTGDYTNVDKGKSRLGKILADKRCLIVLDDLWDVKPAEVLIGSLGTHCRLLITTRDGTLATALGAQECSLDVLSEARALELLADWSDQSVPSLPPEAISVARECGYLPFALALCGAMVRDGTPWTDLLVALREADLSFLQIQFPNYAYPNVLRSLKVSVDQLGRINPAWEEHYRELAVFPHDEAIPESAVLTLWTSAGDMDERRGRQLLMTLERKALLRLTGLTPDRRVSLHDLQHDYLRAVVGNLTEMHSRWITAYRQKCPGGWHSGPDDGYFFQHLTYHLMQAKQDEELIALMEGDFPEVKLGRLKSFADVAHDYAVTMEVCERNQDLVRAVKFAYRRSMMFPRAEALATPGIACLASQVAVAEGNLDSANRNIALAREFVRDPGKLVTILAGIVAGLPPGQEREGLLQSAIELVEQLNPREGRGEEIPYLLDASLGGERIPQELVARVLRLPTISSRVQQQITIIRACHLWRAGAFEESRQLLWTVCELGMALPEEIVDLTLDAAVAVWEDTRSPSIGAELVHASLSGKHLEGMFPSIFHAARNRKLDWIAWAMKQINLSKADTLQIIGFTAMAGRWKASRLACLSPWLRVFGLLDTVWRWLIRLVDTFMRVDETEETRPKQYFDNRDAGWTSIGLAFANLAPDFAGAIHNLNAQLAILTVRPDALGQDQAARIFGDCMRHHMGEPETHRQILLTVVQAALAGKATTIARQALEEWFASAVDLRRVYRVTHEFPYYIVSVVGMMIGMAFFLLLPPVLVYGLLTNRVLPNPTPGNLVGYFVLSLFSLMLYSIVALTAYEFVRRGAVRLEFAIRGFEWGLKTLRLRMARLSEMDPSDGKQRAPTIELEILEDLMRLVSSRPVLHDATLGDQLAKFLHWCKQNTCRPELIKYAGIVALHLDRPDLGQLALELLNKEMKDQVAQYHAGDDQPLSRDALSSLQHRRDRIVELAAAWSNSNAEIGWQIAQDLEGGLNFFQHTLVHTYRSDRKRNLVFWGIQILADQPPHIFLMQLSGLLEEIKRQRIWPNQDVLATLSLVGIPTLFQRVARQFFGILLFPAWLVLGMLVVAFLMVFFPFYELVNFAFKQWALYIAHRELGGQSE